MQYEFYENKVNMDIVTLILNIFATSFSTHDHD